MEYDVAAVIFRKRESQNHSSQISLPWRDGMRICNWFLCLWMAWLFRTESWHARSGPGIYMIFFFILLISYFKSSVIPISNNALIRFLYYGTCIEIQHSAYPGLRLVGAYAPVGERDGMRICNWILCLWMAWLSRTESWHARSGPGVWAGLYTWVIMINGFD